MKRKDVERMKRAKCKRAQHGVDQAYVRQVQALATCDVRDVRAAQIALEEALAGLQRATKKGKTNDENDR